MRADFHDNQARQVKHTPPFPDPVLSLPGYRTYRQQYRFTGPLAFFKFSSLFCCPFLAATSCCACAVLPVAPKGTHATKGARHTSSHTLTLALLLLCRGDTRRGCINCRIGLRRSRVTGETTERWQAGLYGHRAEATLASSQQRRRVGQSDLLVLACLQ